MNFVSQIIDTFRSLADVYKAIGDYEQAYYHLLAFHNIWQGIYSHDSEQRIHAVLANSEIKKVQREAEEQRIKTHYLSRALSNVQKSDEEKTHLLMQLATQAKMLEQLAREDGLTGLSNRRWLDIQLNYEFERARRFDHSFVIAMIDLDNFKSVNDTLSHLTGDEVLRQIAKILRSSCRGVDTVGRYGGEEFVLLLVETTLDQAQEICQKLIQNIRGHSWQALHPRLEKVTLSVGLADNNDIGSVVEMLSIADSQLYRAKRQGKDQVCY